MIALKCWLIFNLAIIAWKLYPTGSKIIADRNSSATISSNIKQPKCFMGDNS